MLIRKPGADEMSVEEFAREVRRIREKALYIYVPPKDRTTYHREYWRTVRSNKHE